MKPWFARLIAPWQSPAETELCAVALPIPVAKVAAKPAPADPATAPDTPSAPPPDNAVDLDLAFLAWMAGGAAFVVAPAGPRERAALRHLDHLIADTGAHHRLLPRAAAVIPPLLARLRSPALSLSDVSQQISRDVTLVAEVIRMANGLHYRRDAAVVELDHAIRLLGLDGLRNAIARAVLKPLIEVRGGKLAAGSGMRLWEHTDKKAQLCAALARGIGFEPFEGYLSGLAHSAVWSAVLRAMDEIEGSPPWRLSPAFVAALQTRRDRLFAVVAGQWQLAPGMAAAAAEHAAHGTSVAAASAAMQLLYRSDRLAWLLCSPDRLHAAATAEALLRDADAAVRACYRALEQAGASARQDHHQP